MPEFEERLTKVYAAKTRGELERLSADLPVAFSAARSSSPGQPAPSTLLLAIMSGFERRGRWNVPKRLTSFTLFGGGVIDLRYADFTSPDVEIHSYSIFGGQTILLPPERRNQGNADRAVKLLSRMLSAVNEGLAGRDYLAGELSIADFALYPVFKVREQMLVDHGGVDNLKRWSERLGAREGVQKGMTAAD
jgi:hypothetical protein